MFIVGAELVFAVVSDPPRVEETEKSPPLSRIVLVNFSTQGTSVADGLIRPTLVFSSNMLSNDENIFSSSIILGGL